MNRLADALTSRRAGLIVTTVLAPLEVATSLSSHRPGNPDDADWLVPTAAIAVLSFAWGRPAGEPVRWVLRSLLLVAAAALLSPLFGHAPARGAWMMGANVLVVNGLYAVYTRHLRGGSLFPQRVRSLLVFTGLVWVAGVACVVLGGVPKSTLGGTGEVGSDVVWVIRSSISLLLGGLTTTAFWHSRAYAGVRVRYRTALPLLLALGSVCLVLPYAAPELPLSWMMCVPALWIGLVLPLRPAAIAVLVAASVPSIIGRSSVSRVHQGLFLESTLLEAVLGMSMVLAFLVVVLREKATRLTSEVSASIEQERAHNALLGAVISSMTDGVLITDDRGAQVFANPAARSLLGRPIAPRPGESPDSGGWVTSHGLRAQDGAPLDPAHRDELQNPPITDFVRTHVRVRAEEEANARVCAVSARSLMRRGRRLVLVIISDATLEHAQRQALESFAGAVAADLKAPLTELTEWVDGAGDVLGAGTAGRAGGEVIERSLGALSAARCAGARMRQLIDDYLALTVARQGVLSQETVSLNELVDQVLEAGEWRPHPSCDDRAVAEFLDIDVPRLDVRVDRRLIQTLLTRLLRDAVGRTPADGRVRLAARTEPDAGWVRVGVARDDPAGALAPVGAARSVSAAAVVGSAQGQVATAPPEPVDRPGSPGDLDGDAATSLRTAVWRAIVDRHGGTLTEYRTGDGAQVVEFTLPTA